MKIKSVKFLKSALWPKDWPETRYPEVAFAGRSNVGKSSLLRALLGIHKLIRISSTPGCTRTINFYNLNDKYIFADLPGYGFAKVSAKLRTKWGKGIELYLSKRKQLKGVILLIDARHGPTSNDLQLWEWLCHHKLSSVVVLTKADKLKQSERSKALKIVHQRLGLLPQDPILFSAKTGEGKGELWKRINCLVKNGEKQPSAKS